MKKKVSRRKQVVAGVMALVISVATMVSAVGVVQAEDATVTDKPMIDLVFENEIGEKKLSQEDADVLAEEFGYIRFDGSVMVCAENTSAKVNWENSTIPYGEVYSTRVFAPILSRDENGKLVIERDEDGYIAAQNEHSGWGGWWTNSDGKIEEWSFCEDSFFDMSEGNVYNTAHAINSQMGCNYFWEFDREAQGYCKKVFNDVYIVQFYYTTDGKGNVYSSEAGFDDRTYARTDYWFLPEDSLNSTILQFEDEETDTTQVEKYTVELAEDKTTISSNELEALLTENQTKDVVIKTNNDVTFTFKKGTMQAVEGKDTYDFSSTLSTTYSTDLPFYVTQNNFIAKMDYHYSGQLPAEATIRFYVGTQYAGKTLYYSLMKENKSYAELQTVTVDEQGYMTVKQNHCSSYVITTENPNTDSATENKDDKITEQEQNNTTQQNNATEQNKDTITGNPATNSAVTGNTNTTTGNTNGNTANAGTGSANDGNIQMLIPNLKKVSNVKNGVKLQWEQVANAKGYYIYRKKGNGTYKQITEVGVNNQSVYVDNTAKNQKTYHYIIKAYNESGESDESNEKTTCFIKVPANVKIKKTLSGTKVTYSKGKKIAGCQVKYVTKGNKKKNDTYTCNSKEMKKISFLLKNVSTKNGIKIRNYIKVGKKTYYSAWKSV